MWDIVFSGPNFGKVVTKGFMNVITRFDFYLIPMIVDGYHKKIK
jgi:hypothetical protein